MFSGLVNGETITVSGAVGTFVNDSGDPDKNAGDQKKVVVSGYSFSGADINNYDLTVSDVKADIGKKDLTVKFTGVYGKYYDGNTNLPADHIAPNGYEGLVAGDELSITISGGTFDDPNVGTNKPVTVNYTLTGADRNNYNDRQEEVKTDIYAVDIPVVFASKTETYDGQQHSVRVTGGTEAGDEILYSTDGVNYSSTLPMFTEAGTYRVWAKVTRNSNYNVWNNYADLTVERRPLTVTFSDPSKEYDGSVDATIAGYTFDNLVTGDQVIITITSAEFYKDGAPDKNVETHKFVDVEPLFGGADANNYEITYTPLYGDITKKDLTLVFTANNKPYDGGVASDAVFSDFTGLVSGDEVTVTNVVGTFADPNVGNGITINMSYTLGGADLGNYNVSEAPIARNITPAVNDDISFRGDSLTYDGVSHKIEVSGTVTGDAVYYSLDGVNYDTAVPAFTDAGTHPVYAKVVRANYQDWIGSALLVIDPKALTVSFTAADKVYDGSNTATATFNPDTGFSGLVSGDEVIITVTSAGFVDAYDQADPNVGTDKDVKVYYSYSGADVNNYTLSGTATATANITVRPLHIYFTANDTLYQAGSTAADVAFSHFGTNDLVVGDSLTVTNVSGTYIDGNGNPTDSVGTHDIRVTYTLSGDAQTLANYQELPQPVSASISENYFDFTFTGDNVTFDGNNHSFTISGTETGDTVLYSTDGVNFNLTQMPTYRNYGSYPVWVKVSRTGYGDQVRSATLNIAKLQLTVTGSAVVSRNYNGSDIAVVNVGAVSTIYGSDVVTVTGTGVFPSAEPGSYSNVAVTYGISGADADNYLAPADELLPGVINAPETPSMVVTTDSDVVDPWDNLISLREALTVYYKTDGTISYNNGNITYGRGNNTTVQFASGLTEIKPEYSYTLTSEHDGLVIEGDDRITFNGQTCLDSDNQNFTIFNVTESASMTFNGLTFKNISTDQGAAIATASGLTLTEGDVLTLSGCKFNTNTGTANGGALSVYNLDVAISGGTFTANSAAYGGAVYVNGGSLTVGGTSVFTGNSATAGNGGAVYAANTTAGKGVSVTGASFASNSTTSNGGAVYLNSVGDSAIVNCTFTSNTATESTTDGKTGNGGAIDSDGGNLTIDGGSFSGNTATENGGAVYVSQDLLTVENVTFTSNSSDEDGGAIYGDDDAVLHLTEAVFTLNSASSDGGAVRGVGVVDKSEFTSNTAANGEGGAIYSEGSKKTASSGSSAPAPTGDDTPVVKSLQVNKSTFTTNSAFNGGAINTDSVNLTVINSDFIENSTTESGGAIQLHKGAATVSGSNFTENTAKSANDYTGHGGAIYNSECTLTVVGSTFEKNESYYGGAISGQVDAESSIFTANKAVIQSYADPDDPNETITTGNGGAVYGNGTFSSCTFTSNTANNGGAFFCLEIGSQVDIDECTFTTNSAAVSGGAVCAVKLHVTESDFNGNTAGTKVGTRYVDGYGGAVGAEDVTADFRFEDCTFTGNAATYGGAVLGEKVTAIRGEFTENAATGSGGAIGILDASADFTINDCDFYRNTAADGGAILAETLSVTDSLFENNTATGAGGGSIAGSGGAIASLDAAADFTILESTFTGNSADFGGAVRGETISIVRSTFEGNAAGTGGAVYGNDASANITVSESHFKSNTATDCGGAIYARYLTVSDNSVFQSNEAAYGGAVSRYTANTSVFTFTDTLFTGNTAERDGGAVFGDSLTATRTTFVGNTAGTGGNAGHGGAVYAANLAANLQFNYCWVVRNSATQGGAIYTRVASLDVYESVVAENTVTASGSESAYGAGIYTSMDVQTSTIRWSTVANNTVTGGGAGADFYGNSSTTVSYSILLDAYQANSSLTYVNSLYQTAGHGGSAVFSPDSDCDVWNGTDPLFAGGTDYRTAYTLAPYSAAINGTHLTTGGPAVGITGETRPSHTYYDYGAIEGGEGAETPSMHVTTYEDVVDMWDNRISLREALTVYYGAVDAGDVSYTNDGKTVTFDTVLTDVSGGTSGAVTVGGRTKLLANGTFDLDASHDGLTIEGDNRVLFDGTSFRIFYLSEAADITVDGMTFQNVSNSSAGAVFAGIVSDTAAAAKTVTFSNSNFFDNTSTGGAGAVRVSNLNLVLNDSTFRGNKGSLVGAVHAVNVIGGVTVTDSTFTANAATRNDTSSECGGGAICSDGGSMTIDGSTFSENSATFGGAINSHTDLTVTDSVFSANTAKSGRGGAIGARKGSPNWVFENCEFNGNSATSGNGFSRGGAISSEAGGSLTLTDCLFNKNKVTGGNAGAINIGTESLHPTVTIGGCTFSENECSYSSGNTGVANFYQCASLDIHDCTFSENTSSGMAPVLRITGYSGQGSCEITRCLFTGNSGNKASDGLIYANEKAVFTVSDSVFTANTWESGQSGNGCIYVNGKNTNNVTLRNCTITNNANMKGWYLASGAKLNIYNTVECGNGSASSVNSGTLLFDHYMSDSYSSADITYDPNLPLFASDGYTPVAGSQVLNTGDSSLTNSTLDFNRHPRIVGSSVDLGAVEYQGTSSASLPYSDAADAAFASLDEDDLGVDFDVF